MRAVRAFFFVLLGTTIAEADDVSHWQVQQDLVGRTFESTSGPCLVLQGLKNTIIEGVQLGPCAEEGLVIADSENVLVRNIQVRDTAGAGVYVLGSTNVTVAGASVSNSVTGISVLNSQQVSIECNRLKNMRGPIPAGQFVQFDKVTGPKNKIMCNAGLNEPGHGQPEDAISLYKSSGLPMSPIMIASNLIVGGGPSASGGGIMLGDDGGSDIVAADNLLIDPGQYGIAVSSGRRISITGNRVFGRRQSFTNVGIYVWNQYDHACEDCTSLRQPGQLDQQRR